MSRILSKLSAKLGNERGESLTEVLAAIVVGGLAILLLAGAVNAAANINRNSREAMDTYYQVNNELVAGSGSDVATGSAKVQISDSSSSHATWASDLNVKYAVVEEAGNTPVVSYEYAPDNEGSGS